MAELHTAPRPAEPAAAPAGQTDADIGRLWAHFKSSGDPEVKNELILHYLYLVKRIVRRMMPKYSGHNEYEDLLNCGVIGLIDAVDKFDLGHGVKFETYAVTRIRGEILDYMRSQDWAPSSLRKVINAIETTYERLESAAGAPPTDQMIASELNMPVAQVQKVMVQSHTFNVINFEDTLSACLPVYEVPAPREEQPENVLMADEMKTVLAGMIDELPEKERLVITLYYYEEMMLKDIAEILQVSESRVSQIHSRVLSRIRVKLQKLI